MIYNDGPFFLGESNFLRLRREPYTFLLKNNLALRVYPNTRPHNLKIAQLQKGLVLVLNKKELIEEGVGFGVPVAIFSDITCFSKSAETLIVDKRQKRIVVKCYHMDTISKIRWKNIFFPEIPIHKFISKKIDNVYRKYQSPRKFILTAVQIRRKIGAKTTYPRIKSRGEIIVSYNISDNCIKVNASFIGLNKLLKKIVFLNEQGSTFFRKFSSNGLVLVDEQIGAWQPLTANQASFFNFEGSLGFCLRNLPNCHSFFGREYLNGLLAWAGVEYEVSPDIDSFEYVIKIIRNNEL